MIKNIFTLLFIVIIGLHHSNGQQTPSFTEYNYNPFVINSAYAGVLTETEATLSNIGFGNQQFNGMPRTLAFTFNAPISRNKMGLGFGFINDEIGVTSSTQFFGAYSYKIILNDNVHPYWKVYDKTFISFGLNAGILLYNQDLQSLALQNDNNFSENISSTLPSMGAGVLFGHANFFAGISIPNLLADTFSNQDNLKLSRPVYAYSGYHFILNKYQPSFILKPSLLMKYENGAPLQLDTNLSLSYKNIVELGAGYRTSTTLNAFLGIYFLENFRAVYSYSQGSADSPLGNTHGIILSYRTGNGFAFK